MENLQQPQGELNEPIDPTVLALTKAIGQAESGGKYDAIGDGGNSQGAFQMSPGFIAEWAPKAGVQYQPGQQLDMEAQNKIAYNAVKTMGTTGDPNHPEYGKLSPSQIASRWNTGDPNMYAEDPSYGKNNAYGSIGGYVDEIKKNYEKNLGISGSVPEVPPQDSGSTPSWLAAAGLGGAAFLLNTVKKIGRPAIVDISTGAGALAGSAVAPGWGTVAGGVGGRKVGNKIADALLGDKKQEIAPVSQGAVLTPPTGPDLISKENQVGPKGVSEIKIPEAPDESMSAATQVHDAITKMMQGTQSGRNYSASQPGKEAIGTAAIFGLVHPDENGALTFDEGKRQNLLGKVGDLQDKVIEAQGGSASPLSVLNYAGSYIGGDRYATAVERQQAAKVAQKEVMAHGIAPKGQMSLSDMREAQKQHYSAAKRGYQGGRTTAEILAHKALGNAYGRVIRENLSDQELYDRTKKMEAALINVKEVGKRVQGKNAPKNQGLIKDIMHSGSRWAAVYIGDKIGGPIGAILGDMVGIHLSRKIDRKFGKTTFETPAMQKALAILGEGNPEVYNTLISELKNNGISVPEISDATKEDLDTVPEVKKVVADLKDPKGGEFKWGLVRSAFKDYATSVQSRSPTKKQGLLSRQPPKKGQS